MINHGKLRNGDVFGVYSKDLFSWAVNRYQRKACKQQSIKVPDGKYPTHVGVIRKTLSGVFAIESLPKSGVVISDISKYNNREIEFYRFNDITRKQAARFVDKATTFNGSEYDYVQLIDIFLYAIFGIRSEFETEKRLICSELVGQSARHIYKLFYPREQVKLAMLCPIHIKLSNITRLVE